MLVTGSNAITDGVTIDLRELNQNTFNAKTETASVGGGAKWGEVYKALEAHGYAIPGAEASEVGVADISFFAARFVQRPQRRRWKSRPCHPIRFRRFSRGDLWGGRVTYDYSAVQKSFQPMTDWVEQANVDPFSLLIQFGGHDATTNQTFTANAYQYTGNASEKPYYDSSDPSTNPNEFPAPSVNFTFDNIGTPPPGGADLRVDSLYNITSALNTPDGLLNIYAGLIFKATTLVLAQVNNIIQSA